MTEQEKRFSQRLIEKIEQAEKHIGYNGIKEKANIEKFGGVQTLKRELFREGCSHGFLFFKEKNRLDLTAETLVIDGQFSGLFEDEEVNVCLNLLCECDYF